MPSFFCISSNVIPFVSGTMVLTQMSCRTIMKQKNPKMIDGFNISAIFGNTSVIDAAKYQWVKLPNA